jgi:hypothetical protein
MRKVRTSVSNRNFDRDCDDAGQYARRLLASCLAPGFSRSQRYPMSPRTFPRNTQWDHAVYIRMTGSSTSVPMSRKACVLGDDAACHRE